MRNVRRPDKTGVVLIGMPGVGKSTAGVLLAKRLGLGFLDTDVHIQTLEGLRLSEIIQRESLAGFCRIEEQHVLSISPAGCVIATGGSVVYSERAMTHLRDGAVIVHLDLEPSLLKQRLDNMDARGVVRAPGQTVADLYRERSPLYRRYEDMRIDCDILSPEEVIAAIVNELLSR
ncbi:MAG: shikimate kinase [Desulfobacterales bacterium]|nr:shikimate kinase [Desulfobacterales bacterium]